MRWFNPRVIEDELVVTRTAGQRVGMPDVAAEPVEEVVAAAAVELAAAQQRVVAVAAFQDAALIAALIGSTALTIAVAALVFVGIDRLTGGPARAEEQRP